MEFTVTTSTTQSWILEEKLTEHFWIHKVMVPANLYVFGEAFLQVCTMHACTYVATGTVNGMGTLGGNLRYAYDLENFVVLIIIGANPQPVRTILVRRQGTMHQVLRKARKEQKDHALYSLENNSKSQYF